MFDKTGTLTQGVFEVTAVHHNTMDEAKLLEYAALAECDAPGTDDLEAALVRQRNNLAAAGLAAVK